MPAEPLWIAWLAHTWRKRTRQGRGSACYNLDVSVFFRYPMASNRKRFKPIHCACVVFYYRRIARKTEAGRGGILRSINRSAPCPAMWRLTFSGGGHLVRLSANGCQPHRPNTALLFCEAGYRSGLLRTFREHDLNCNRAAFSMLVFTLTMNYNFFYV